jgi:hypothetical protein
MRLANYVKTLRRDLLKVSEACGVPHPGLIDADDIEILFAQREAVPLRDVYGYQPGWGAVSGEDRDALVALMGASGHGAAAPPSRTAQA